MQQSFTSFRQLFCNYLYFLFCCTSKAHNWFLRLNIKAFCFDMYATFPLTQSQNSGRDWKIVSKGLSIVLWVARWHVCSELREIDFWWTCVMYDWKGAALQFHPGLLCIRLAGLWYQGSICQWTPISLQHLPITIDLGGKERAWSKQQTQTFSKIPQSHRAQFQQRRFNESLGFTRQKRSRRKANQAAMDMIYVFIEISYIVGVQLIWD